MCPGLAGHINRAGWPQHQQLPAEVDHDHGGSKTEPSSLFVVVRVLSSRAAYIFLSVSLIYCSFSTASRVTVCTRMCTDVCPVLYKTSLYRGVTVSQYCTVVYLCRSIVQQNACVPVRCLVVLSHSCYCTVQMISGKLYYECIIGSC